MNIGGNLVEFCGGKNFIGIKHNYYIIFEENGFYDSAFTGRGVINICNKVYKTNFALKSTIVRNLLSVSRVGEPGVDSSKT